MHRCFITGTISCGRGAMCDALTGPGVESCLVVAGAYSMAVSSQDSFRWLGRNGRFIRLTDRNQVVYISRLNDMGVRLSIDDFGTGYSSLASLKRLPVKEIKVDQSFVKNMAVNENDAMIVRSTIELAHNLCLEVVAEGVEDQPTLDRLTALGCDSAQGYFMCRPLPSVELGRWLTESPWGLKRE